MHWIQRNSTQIRIVLNFGPEKCLKESKVTCGVTSKRQVWSTFFLFEFFDHMSKGKFGPHSNCSRRQVWSRFGEKTGPNLPFENISLTWFKLFKKGNFGQFECGPNLPFDTWSLISKSKKMDQICLLRSNFSRDSGLFQIFFWTKISDYTYQRNDPFQKIKKLIYRMFS